MPRDLVRINYRTGRIDKRINPSKALDRELPQRPVDEQEELNARLTADNRQRKEMRAQLDLTSLPVQIERAQRVVEERTFEALRGPRADGTRRSREHMNELEFPNGFGINREPLGKVNQRLWSEGLLITGGRRADFVLTFSEQELNRFYQVRMVFETPSSRVVDASISAETRGDLHRVRAETDAVIDAEKSLGSALDVVTALKNERDLRSRNERVEATVREGRRGSNA